MDAGQQSGGRSIADTFYDLCSEIWSGSPATESIQADLETVESLKAPADEDIDLLQRVYKENNNVELGEEEDFGNEAPTMVSASSSITSSATSSVTPIQQNLPLTSTPIQPSSSESSNKTSRGQTSREKMEKMLKKRRNKKNQISSQRLKPVQIQRKKNFRKTY